MSASSPYPNGDTPPFRLVKARQPKAGDPDVPEDDGRREASGKKARGAKRKKIDPAIVDAMAYAGATMLRIAAFFDVEEATIYRQYGDRIKEIRHINDIKVTDGPKPLTIDPNHVEKLAQMGCPDEVIGMILGCSGETIRKRFVEVLKRARGNLYSRLSLKGVSMALDGNVPMLTLALKNFLNWTDRTDVTVNGSFSLDPAGPLAAMLALSGQAVPGAPVQIPGETSEEEIVVISSEGSIEVKAEPGEPK